jgi:hypothetical protein
MDNGKAIAKHKPKAKYDTQGIKVMEKLLAD